MIRKRIQTFRYAFNGLADVFRTQANMRIHAAAAAAAICLGLFFKITAVEWCMVALAIGMVLLAEVFNTAIEYLTDLASPDMHPLAGKAKDAAAAAVLIAAAVSAVIGCIIFLPHFVRLLN
ncbi:MAG: diacylglycerol kinase family protein [Saprospiraceae bacterium]|nr:diacylglycerol kinase family protein [Saprospiraceae bacterium]